MLKWLRGMLFYDESVYAVINDLVNAQVQLTLEVGRLKQRIDALESEKGRQYVEYDYRPSQMKN